MNFRDHKDLNLNDEFVRDYHKLLEKINDSTDVQKLKEEIKRLGEREGYLQGEVARLQGEVKQTGTEAKKHSLQLSEESRKELERLRADHLTVLAALKTSHAEEVDQKFTRTIHRLLAELADMEAAKVELEQEAARKCNLLEAQMTEKFAAYQAEMKRLLAVETLDAKDKVVGDLVPKLAELASLPIGMRVAAPIVDLCFWRPSVWSSSSGPSGAASFP